MISVLGERKLWIQTCLAQLKYFLCVAPCTSGGVGKNVYMWSMVSKSELQLSSDFNPHKVAHA